jgi:coenzyme Q-binding protein COQ10
MRVGWDQFDETFHSSVHCEPENLVVQADASQNALFEQLLARWAIRDVAGSEKGLGGRGGEKSDVELKVEFRFMNPLYSMVSSAVAPKVAALMIEAFEKRAIEVLGGEDTEKISSTDR